ncbi:MAG: hypothetical protein IPJ34_26465 [Myxococcales bacterium]|nr:hypothetical protein [Myxococcales bacterium]
MSGIDEVILNQIEAHDYAVQHPQKEISEALLYAISEALFTLAADTEYVRALPRQRFDMLQYVKVLDALLERRERLLKILGGDFTSDWLPPELEAALHDKKAK